MNSGTAKIRVLHITPWYPSPKEPYNAIYIQRHVEALQPYCENIVLHIDLEMTAKDSFRSTHNNVIHLRKKVAIKSWIMLEWQFYRLLKKELKALNARDEFTHVNFHIAYPSMLYFNKLKALLPTKQLITEHWSAYHYNFFSSKNLTRLKKIFKHNVPVVAVSETLANDIRKFSDTRPNITIIPNVVDTSVFQHKNKPRKSHFFAAALWKFPKKPLEILELVRIKKESGHSIILRIAGYGPYEKEMLEFIALHNLSSHVTFLGQLNSNEIADELNEAQALMLPTGYETFSAIIAEALCCGCPVIANDVGAIHELINTSNGILIQENWNNTLESFQTIRFDHAKIAENAQSKFAKETVGNNYFQFLNSL